MSDDFDAQVTRHVDSYGRLSVTSKRVSRVAPVGSEIYEHARASQKSMELVARAILTCAGLVALSTVGLAFVNANWVALIFLAVFIGIFGMCAREDAAAKIPTVPLPRGVDHAITVIQDAKRRFLQLDSPVELMVKVEAAEARALKQLAIFVDEESARRHHSPLHQAAEEEIFLLAAQLEVTLAAQSLRHRVTGSSAPMELSFRNEALQAQEEAEWLSKLERGELS